MREAVLALDQGSQSSRACLLDASGTALAEAQTPVRTDRRSAGEAEHDARQVLGSLLAAAQRALLAAAGEVRITAAGLATQRSTTVCFDTRTRQVLSPAISWQDRRHADWLATFAAHASRVRTLTGLPLSPHYGVAKMRWCLDQLPAVQTARERGTLQMAPLAAWLVMQLTGGEALLDPANASRTLLWDISRRSWSNELCWLFGVEPRLLPRVVATRSRFGSLRLPAAPGTHAAAAAPAAAVELRAVTGDQSAIPFAFGIPDVRTLYINVGTGAFLQRPTCALPLEPAPLLAGVLAADERHAQYCLEGTVNGAGSAVSAFLQRELPAATAAHEAALWSGLEQLPPGTALPVYVNGIGGLGSPYWRAQQPSYFIGTGSTLERFAALLESIVFLIAINFGYLRARGGPEALERVIITGGLSRSDWLCRRLAALLAIPVLRAAREATLLGVAALADPQLLGPAGRPAPLAGATRFDPLMLADVERSGLAARFERLRSALG